MIRATLAVTLGLSVNVQAQTGVIRFDGLGNFESSSLPGSNYVQMSPTFWGTILLNDQGLIEDSFTYLDQSLSYQRLIIPTGNYYNSVSAIDMDGRLHRDNTYGCIDSNCQGGKYDIYSEYQFTDAVVLEKYDDSYKEWVVGLTDEGEVVELAKIPESLCTPNIPSGNGYQSIHAAFSSNGVAIAAINQDGFILTQCCTEGGEEQTQFLNPPPFAGFTQVLIGLSTALGESFEGVGIQEGGDVYMWGGNIGPVTLVATGMKSIFVHNDEYVSGVREDGTPDWNLKEEGSNYPEDIQVISIDGADGTALIEYSPSVFTANPSNIQETYDICSSFDTIEIVDGNYELTSLTLGKCPKALTIRGSGNDCRIELKGSEGFNDSVGEFVIRNATIVLNCEGEGITPYGRLKFVECDFQIDPSSNSSSLESIFGSLSFAQGVYTFENCTFSGADTVLMGIPLVAKAESIKFQDCDLSNVNFNYLNTFPAVNLILNDCILMDRPSGGPFDSAISIQRTHDGVIDLTGTIFSNNSSLRGGAICIGPDENNNTGSNIGTYIRGGTFFNNNAVFGGAIYSSHDKLNVTGSVFLNNQSINGGSIYCTGQTGNSQFIENCSFIPNGFNSNEIESFRTDIDISDSLFSGEPDNGYSSIWKSNKSVFTASNNVFCGNINNFSGLSVVDEGGNSFESDCEQVDCNANGQIDSEEIDSGSAVDCDLNGILDSCEVASDPSLDCDASGTLDSCDVENGTLNDCNQNQIGDVCEITANPGLDSNADGIIDSCQCITDINLDGATDFTDIVQLLSCWQEDADGVCTFADVNKDEVIDFGDLILVLSGFGPC